MTDWVPFEDRPRPKALANIRLTYVRECVAITSPDGDEAAIGEINAWLIGQIGLAKREGHVPTSADAERWRDERDEALGFLFAIVRLSGASMVRPAGLRQFMAKWQDDGFGGYGYAPERPE